MGSMRTIVVDGTPADCVRLGVKVFEQEFDLVVSGIKVWDYGSGCSAFEQPL